MNELPCVGAGITVVDPGPNTDAVFARGRDGRPHAPRKERSKYWRDHPLRLLKAYVVGAHVHERAPDDGLGAQILWKCGGREGTVFQLREGVDWLRGHGPQARGALLAQRALERTR